MLDLQQALLSSFDFDAAQIFTIISSNGEVITGEDFIAFITGFDREISTEEIGCLLRVTDRQGEGQLYLEDFKFYMATLGLKKPHDIFD